ncbi:MAG: protein phosphatase 2C domain-containing protein [Acidobacteria bacterium]|nr:protein phosphatase 2C domain-containing protein [Acidobacteriota bacterium]
MFQGRGCACSVKRGRPKRRRGSGRTAGSRRGRRRPSSWPPACNPTSALYYESPEEPGLALRRAVEEANRRIHDAAAADESKHGMGTTCTALALCGATGYAAHVGDSRLYMLRAGQLYQLSEDHSAVNEMVKLGIITKEQARTHEDKNVILRALGTSPEVEASTVEPFEARVGDRFLLCSDGLHDLVLEDEIASLLGEAEDIHAAGERLIAMAKGRGGHDNITVGIIAIMPEGTAAAEAGDAPTTREVEAL